MYKDTLERYTKLLKAVSVWNLDFKKGDCLFLLYTEIFLMCVLLKKF